MAERIYGVVSRVDRTVPAGWVRAVDGKKEWNFLACDLKGGLCISKIKKGLGISFLAEEGPNPRARQILPFKAFVVDNWGDED